MAVITNPNPDLQGAPTANGVPVATQQDLNALRSFWAQLLPQKITELVFNGGQAASGSTPAPVYSNLQSNTIMLEPKVRPTLDTLLTANYVLLPTWPTYKDTSTALATEVVSYGLTEGFGSVPIKVRGNYQSSVSGGQIDELTFTFTWVDNRTISTSVTLTRYSNVGAALDISAQLMPEVPLPAGATSAVVGTYGLGQNANANLTLFRYRQIPLSYFAFFAR